LVDENLGASKLPGLLRKAGYKVVTHQKKYNKQKGILDPVVISECGRDKQVLLTADGKLEALWAVEIQIARLAVVILANNTDGAKAWGARLKAGKEDILRRLRENAKPCALRFGVHGRVTHIRLYGPKRGTLIPV
jgi:hypothetical protein